MHFPNHKLRYYQFKLAILLLISAIILPYPIYARSSLLELAKAKFNSLSISEQKLFECIDKGVLADYQVHSKLDNPENAVLWGPERTIDAKKLSWLCNDKEAVNYVTNYGIEILCAKIKGVFDISYSHLPFALSLHYCVFTDSIKMVDAQILGLYLDGSHITSLMADRVNVDKSVNLRHNFKSTGEIRLNEAQIGGQLDCEQALFNNPNGNALFAPHLYVKSGIYLRNNFASYGTINLIEVNTDGSLSSIGSTFENPGGNSIFADKANIKGSLTLTNFNSKGAIKLNSAKIMSGFICCEGILENHNGQALMAEGAEIHGRTDLYNLHIIGNIILRNSTFECLWWERFTLDRETGINLAEAKIGFFIDDTTTWPKKRGNLVLKGTQIDHLHEESSNSAEKRIKWLRLLNQFTPEPYDQMAKNIRQIGYNQIAKKVLYAKEEDSRKYGKMAWYFKPFHWMFGIIFEYGIFPERVIPIWCSIIIALGWFIYRRGYKKGKILETKQRPVYFLPQNMSEQSTINEYPVFSPLVYSIEIFIPVINFKHCDFWQPVGAYRIYNWFQIVIGWAFTIWIISIISGIIKTA